MFNARIHIGNSFLTPRPIMCTGCIRANYAQGGPALKRKEKKDGESERQAKSPYIFYQDREERQGRSSHRFYQFERRAKGDHSTGFIRTRGEPREIIAQVLSGREERQGRSPHMFYQDEKRDKGGHLTGFYQDERRDKEGHLTCFIRRRGETREVTSHVLSGREERQGRSPHRVLSGREERQGGSPHRLHQDEGGGGVLAQIVSGPEKKRREVLARFYHQSGRRDKQGPITGCIRERSSRYKWGFSQACITRERQGKF